MTDVAPETVEALVATVWRALVHGYGPGNGIMYQDSLEALDRLHYLLLRAEEFYKAYEVVERGIIDFDLHAAAVERLRAAQAAMQAALATPRGTKP